VAAAGACTCISAISPGGTIGEDGEDESLKNTASDTAQGHAVYAYDSAPDGNGTYYRDSTVDTGVDLHYPLIGQEDSTDGNWTTE
jgi:hypothetical protein